MRPLRISQLGEAWRLANSQIFLQTYLAGVIGPHGDTVRFSYTQPSGGRGLVLASSIAIRRDGAPTTAGRVKGLLQLNGITVLITFFFGGAVDVSDRADIGHGIVLDGGDLLEGLTGDSSTGGSVTYALSAQILSVVRHLG